MEMMLAEERLPVVIVALDMDHHTLDIMLDRQTWPDEEDKKVDRNRVFGHDSSKRHEDSVSMTEVSMIVHATSKN